MIISYVAALVYGVLAIVAALTLSSQVGSPIATALAFAAAGLSYVYHVVQTTTGRDPDWLLYAVVGALLASITTSLGSTL